MFENRAKQMMVGRRTPSLTGCIIKYTFPMLDYVQINKVRTNRPI